MRLIVSVVFGVICVTWCYAENPVGGAQSFIYLAQNLNSDNGHLPSNQFQSFVPFPQGAIKYDYKNLENLQSLPTEVIYGTSKEIQRQPPKPLNLPVIQKQQPLRPIAPLQQQLQADEATAFPVRLSFSVNHGDYTFLPTPQIFYPSHQLPLPTHHTLQEKNAPPKKIKSSPAVRPFKQLNYQPISYPLPQIQYFGQPTQYPPQPIQHLPRPLPLPVPKHLKAYPANVYPNNPKNGFPITKPHGHPPVKPYPKGPVSQSEKFRQQIYSKPQERPIDPPKHVQEQNRPTPPPHSPKVKEEEKEEEEKEEEEDKEEDDDKKEESSGEQEEDEDEESGEESDDEGSERSSEGDDEEEEDEEEDEEEEEEGQEENSKKDTEKEASHLPPSHDHGEYDFDNRDYSPSFSAAKYIFNYDDDDDERKRPHKKTKHHKEERKPYHQHHIKPDFRSNSHVKQSSPKPKLVEKPREEPPKNNYYFFYGPNEPIPKQSQSAPVVKNLHREKWYLTSKKI